MSELTFYCDMQAVCKSCVLYIPPYQCCYQEFLLTRRECNFRKCYFSRVCPHADPQAFKNKEFLLSNSLGEQTNNVFRNVATAFPSAFIPEVMPMKKEAQDAISIAKDVKVPIIAVSLQNFFRGIDETLALRRARKLGLHQFFGFSGEIILTTDVKNRLCDWFAENPHYFKMLLEQLEPNYVTTLDTYTHSNVPACISRLKMMETTLSTNNFLNLKTKIIGLSLGATPKQVYDYTTLLMKMGCKIIAHPVYEFRKTADTDSIRWRLRISQKLGAKTLLLSCGAGVSSRMRVYSDYYSTWSWFSSINSRIIQTREKRMLKLKKMMKLGKGCSEQSHLEVNELWA